MTELIKQPEAEQLADALSGVMYSADDVVQAAALLRTQHAQLLEWEAKATTWLLSPEAATRLDGYRELGAMVAKAEDEAERLRAELARLTTLRPASEHKTGERVLIWEEARLHADRWLFFNHGTRVPTGAWWTPLPDVKEPTP
jgi:hypothetical protein